MSKPFSILETAAWLKDNDNYLLITHKRPDGDTLGSAGALAQGLREIGKTVYVFENPEVTPRYAPCVKDYIAPDDYNPEYIIAIDTATLDLFTQTALKYKDKISLCIDHHESNTNYAAYLCINPERAACGELIYEILMEISGNISKITAGHLYVALSTDTGCFSYANTTANTFAVASFLAETGAPIRELNKKLFRTKTRSRIKIEGLIASKMEFHFDGRVAIAIITREMMETSGANEDDIDDISNLPVSIEGVGYGITLRELTSPTDCKISCRTVPPNDANELCKKFGGGGHKTAAGASVSKTIDEIKAEILETLSKWI